MWGQAVSPCSLSYLCMHWQISIFQTPWFLWCDVSLPWPKAIKWKNRVNTSWMQTCWRFLLLAWLGDFLWLEDIQLIRYDPIKIMNQIFVASRKFNGCLQFINTKVMLERSSSVDITPKRQGSDWHGYVNNLRPRCQGCLGTDQLAALFRQKLSNRQTSGASLCWIAMLAPRDEKIQIHVRRDPNYFCTWYDTSWKVWRTLKQPCPKRLILPLPMLFYSIYSIFCLYVYTVASMLETQEYTLRMPWPIQQSTSLEGSIVGVESGPFPVI